MQGTETPKSEQDYTVTNGLSLVDNEVYTDYQVDSTDDFEWQAPGLDPVHRLDIDHHENGQNHEQEVLHEMDQEILA